MDELALEHLLEASRVGGASTLAVITELAPAAGPHAGVAPARYLDGSRPTYLFQTRYVDGEACHVVTIDSKGSSLNRVEEQIALAIRDGVAPLDKAPRIRVKYSDQDLLDLEIPHRAFDGHIRAGTINGEPATANTRYRAVRDATVSDARPLLEASPHSLVFGSWDATRKHHQGQYSSALVGEIIGVLADQSNAGLTAPRTGGARVDPYAASVRLTPADMEALANAQQHELSAGNFQKIKKDIAGGKKDRISASNLGLGAIPPSLEGLGVVACSRIIRSFVLSFATLRGLRFNAGVEGDAACRALLAAYALAGLARSQAELRIRANCDLIETAPPTVALDARYGNSIQLAPISIDSADALLSAAIGQATKVAGIAWEGAELEVIGSPLVSQGVVSEEEK